ncbi:hypothetical protein VEx25_A0185 [Vibrio antiquarius]|uniref:Uncharacterized protein n=1 Tax=Vibrio antiquarius (strain Ex25) TaxID=150340 RepID=A0ABM9WYE5_VIBAE|nr:hypothetical protein VEx25_A0185 [Vibrio antiquarius]EMD80241.1 hypothetical protein C408_1244 [Vibrio diabolicus E0666]
MAKLCLNISCFIEFLFININLVLKPSEMDSMTCLRMGKTQPQ